MSPREKNAGKITPTGEPTVTVTPAGLTLVQTEGNKFMLQFTVDDPASITETKAFMVEGKVTGHSDVTANSATETVDSEFCGATVIMVVPRDAPRGVDFGDAGSFIPEADTGNGDKPVPDQVPTLTLLAPSTAPIGASPLQVVCTGTNFAATSKVQTNLNGPWEDRPTTYVSATSVKADLLPPAGPGTHMLRIANVASPSQGLTFTWTATAREAGRDNKHESKHESRHDK